MIKQLVLDNLSRGAKNALFLEEMDIQSIFSKDDEFRRNFRNSMDFFMAGAWDKSLEAIKLCLGKRPKDGATIDLYKFMEANDFKVPTDWKGVRDMECRLKLEDKM